MRKRREGAGRMGPLRQANVLSNAGPGQGDGHRTGKTKAGPFAALGPSLDRIEAGETAGGLKMD